MEINMTDRPDLPGSIAAFFAADTWDSETVARCFANDAVVKDEGHTYTGIGAILQWKAGSSAKFTYTHEPFAVAFQDSETVVTSRLTGNFPGSPVDLRYCVRLGTAPIQP
jgi:hypothetical protein